MMDADTTWKIARTKRAAGGGRVRGWTRAWSALAAVLVVVVGIGLTLRPHAALTQQSSPLAPNFALPVASAGDLRVAQSGTLTLRALRGHPVLLSFFLSTCGPCLAELPLLRQTARTYRAQGLVVVGVATLGDTVTTARRLARAARLTYPVVVDTQAVAWQYGVSDVPTSVFVDTRGRLAGQHIGPLDPQTIRDGLAQVGALHCQQCSALEPLSVDTTPASSATFSADFTFARSKKAPPFALRDQDGRLVSPRSLRGRMVALTFVSALCREQCPLIGQTLTTVRQQLGPAARRLSIVAISVDPEVDTPTATRAFAAESGWGGADWHYLTASRAALARVWSAYGTYVQRPTSIFTPGQTIAHQAGLFLLDGQGHLRAYYDTPVFASRVSATIRALMAPHSATS